MPATTKAAVAAIFDHFETLSDPRIERNKLHQLHEMVVVALCAAICGAEGWADVERFGNMKLRWFRRFLKLEHGIPSHDTFGRVFALLDTHEFLTCLQSWIECFQSQLQAQGVAIDGKTLRRSFDTATGHAALHLVSAWATDLRVCLGQVAVGDQSNEITAVPRLLALLELTGAVVTLDAMHCQTATAAAIRKQQADYVLTVKQNQPKLWQEVLDTFIAYEEQGDEQRQLRRHTTTEQGHGRYERREYFVAPAPAHLKSQWPDVQAIGKVFRTRQVGDKLQEETVLFISSLPPRVRKLAKYLRGHWGVENSLHWVLDVTFREDDSRIRKGSGPEIASMFRKLALNILQRDTTLKSSLRGKRLQAGWNNDALEAMLAGFNKI
jgi:predicted transposase YbfD/YdcC